MKGQAVSPVDSAGSYLQPLQWLLMRWMYLPLAT